ncbi:MAG: hypothetical protein AAFO75_06280 [Pseudomonadota bacterium]
MSHKLKITAAVALLIGSTAAHAFQQQTTGAPAAAQSVDSKAQVLDLGAGSPADVSVDKSTEVRIPGLGKLGVLPKMDFGLELLYGAADLPLTADEQFSEPDQDGDLKVRGTVKHRF